MLRQKTLPRVVIHVTCSCVSITRRGEEAELLPYIFIINNSIKISEVFSHILTRKK